MSLLHNTNNWWHNKSDWSSRPIVIISPWLHGRRSLRLLPFFFLDFPDSQTISNTPHYLTDSGQADVSVLSCHRRKELIPDEMCWPQKELFIITLHLVDAEMPHVQTERSPTAFFFFSSDHWSAFHFPTCQKMNKAFVPLISSNDPAAKKKKRPSAPNEVPAATWDRSAARSRRG